MFTLNLRSRFPEWSLPSVPLSALGILSAPPQAGLVALGWFPLQVR
jgi:hypothetical protein